MATRSGGTKATEPKPTLVLMVRHGKTGTTGRDLPGRAPGLHLADVGRQQAEAAAARMEGLDIAAVYASPLERTRETAAPIAKQAGVRVRTNKGLIELDVGDWTGQKLSALRKKPEWKRIQSTPSHFTFPGGESFRTMQARIVSTIEGLVAQHPGETIVVVSHADPIRAAVADALGVHLDLFQRIVAGPCSVSAVLHTPGGPMVLGVNTTDGPLEGLGPS